jgi:hypothetical protein
VLLGQSCRQLQRGSSVLLLLLLLLAGPSPHVSDQPSQRAHCSNSSGLNMNNLAGLIKGTLSLGSGLAAARRHMLVRTLSIQSILKVPCLCTAGASTDAFS